MTYEALAEGVQEFGKLEALVLVERLLDKLVDGLGGEQGAELLERLLGGAANAVVFVDQMKDKADQIRVDLLVKERLARAVSKAMQRAKERHGSPANVGLLLRGKGGSEKEEERDIPSSMGTVSKYGLSRMQTLTMIDIKFWPSTTLATRPMPSRAASVSSLDAFASSMPLINAERIVVE